MKDKREALMEQIEDEIFCKDPTWTSGDIADFILLRERSLRENLSKALYEKTDAIKSRDFVIKKLEQENASLIERMGKVREVLLSKMGKGVSDHDTAVGAYQALCLLNEA